MKVFMIVLCLGFMSSSFAEEASTDCPAMNESREKNVKQPQEKPKSEDSSAVQQ